MWTVSYALQCWLRRIFILWPCLQPPLPFLVMLLPIHCEFCTRCYISYLAVPCTLLIGESHIRAWPSDCQAAYVLSVGYCYAYILEFLGLPIRLSVPTPLHFLSHAYGSKARSLSLGLQVTLALSWPPHTRAQILSWACVMRRTMTTTCSVHTPIAFNPDRWTDTHKVKRTSTKQSNVGALAHARPQLFCLWSSCHP